MSEETVVTANAQAPQVGTFRCRSQVWGQQNDYHQLRREAQTLHSRLDAAHLIELEAHSESPAR